MNHGVKEKWGDFTKEINITKDSLCFLLHGKKGTVNFLINLGWQETDYNDIGFIKVEASPPYAQDLGWHSKKPQYKDHEVYGKCEWIDKKEECYYDGTACGSSIMFHVFLQDGTDAVFEKLRKHYLEYYSKEK